MPLKHPVHSGIIQNEYAFMISMYISVMCSGKNNVCGDILSLYSVDNTTNIKYSLQAVH